MQQIYDEQNMNIGKKTGLRLLNFSLASSSNME